MYTHLSSLGLKKHNAYIKNKKYLAYMWGDFINIVINSKLKKTFSKSSVK